MAEAQARVEEAPFEFHVPLDEGTEDDSTTEDTEGEAAGTEAEGESPEPKEEELLSAEEAGVDENSPEYQALRKKFIAAYQKKLDAERKKMKPQETVQKATEQPAAQPDTTEGDPFDAVYAVNLDTVKPTLTFREGSDLADYADELTDVVGQAVKQYVQAALEGVKSNDKAFRSKLGEAERVGKAREVITSYAQEIADHPEYEDKAEAIAEFANKTRSIAVDDPELWIEMVEKKFGLTRGWKGDAEAQQKQTGRENIRLATKPRAVVSRPTRGVPSTTSGGSSFDDALAAAMRKAGL